MDEKQATNKINDCTAVHTRVYSKFHLAEHECRPRQNCKCCLKWSRAAQSQVFNDNLEEIRERFATTAGKTYRDHVELRDAVFFHGKRQGDAILFYEHLDEIRALRR